MARASGKKKLGTWSTPTRRAAPARGLRRGRELVPDRTTPTIRGKKIFAEPGSKTPCIRKGKKGARAKGLRKPCHVELLFLGKNLGPRFGVEPGSYLQFCRSWGEVGDLIPVTDHREAQEISRRYCNCRAEGGSESSCARQIGAERPTRRPRKRK